MKYYRSEQYFYQPYVAKPNLSYTESCGTVVQTTTAKPTSSSANTPIASVFTTINPNQTKIVESEALNATTHKADTLESSKSSQNSGRASNLIATKHAGIAKNATKENNKISENPSTHPENLLLKDVGDRALEKSIDNEITKIMLQKSTTTIEKSIPENPNAESGQKGPNDAEDATSDTDAGANLPETARDTRKTDPSIKTEASTHDVRVDKITQKVNSTVNFEIIRELLGSLVGLAKAEEILPKSHFNDKTVLISRTKRSISPDKLVKHEISNQQLKLLLKQSKDSKKLNKKFRVKRGSSGLYTNHNNFPTIVGQIPELVRPSATKETNTEIVSKTNSYNKPSSIPEIPASDQEFGTGIRYSYAVRHNIQTASFDLHSRIKPIPGNYGSSDAPLIKNTYLNSPLSSRSTAPKNLGDLSDFPVLNLKYLKHENL